MKKGYFITLEGVDGAEKIKQIMQNFRSNTPKKLGDYKVLKVRDYDSNKIWNMETGTETETGLPKSNVLYYELENDSWCCVRPSGTEPKIKFYIGIKGTSLDDADQKERDLQEAVRKMI